MRKGFRWWAEFKEFAVRGNMIDLAVGVIIGSAFTAITNSLVKDILMPPLGLLLNGVDFSNLFLTLSGEDYATLSQAQAAGAATLNYGLFLNAIIDFLIVAIAVFVLIRQINRFRRANKDDAPNTKDCPYCFTSIARQATRCPHCTSPL